MNLRIVRRALPPESAAVPEAGAPAARGEALSWPGCDPVLTRIYRTRGIRAPQELALGLEHLLPVSGLGGVEAAVDLLVAHRERRVLVIGDFDADGATSTALMLRALRALDFAQVDFLVPNRFEFGYGLTPEIVTVAQGRAPSLIVTVDNGISSHAGVAAARASGIDVLITDHHLAPAQLPQANAIVNPNAAGNRFESKALAGVGVAFYVMAALARRLAAPAQRVSRWLDLVALGTVADLVPLDRNNRVLVAQGLTRIRAGACVPGITALLAVGKRRSDDVSAADLGFTVGPRLNAAGRLDDMSIGIRCLLSDDANEAATLAARLDTLNRERREIEADMQATALAAVRQLREPAQRESRAGVVLYDPGWHQGVVGLVASRIKEKLRRPVVAFADANNGELRGSARSIAGVHIRDVLDAMACRDPELISRFGGHAMAAGLTLPRSRLDQFAQAFDREVRACLGAALDADCIATDGELEPEAIALTTAAALRAGGPWGQAFPEPSFDGEFRVHRWRVVGERHLKMWVEPKGSGRQFDAIAFNYFDDTSAGQSVPDELQLVYRLDINEYAGERRLQLLVEHVIEASSATMPPP